MANETAESIRSKLSRQSTANTDDSQPETVSSIRNELDNLKKKYDAVVDYTVHLTAERDAIVAQLEDSQKELSRELLRRKNGNDVSSKNPKLERAVDKKSENKVSLDIG